MDGGGGAQRLRMGDDDDEDCALLEVLPNPNMHKRLMKDHPEFRRINLNKIDLVKPPSKRPKLCLSTPQQCTGGMGPVRRVYLS